MQNSSLMVGVLVALLAAAVTTAAAQAPPPPRCLNQTCGNLSVPYPFGMDSDCYREKKFFINCSYSTNPPTAYLGNGNLPVTNISLEEGELQIQMIIARNCYDKRVVRPDNIVDSWIRTPDFTISATKNKFMAVGCDTEALFGGYRGGERYMSGCTSFCQSSRSISESCSGIGCCQTSIPSGLKNQNITLGSYYNHNYSRNFNPCSYAFVVEDGKFNFSGEKSFLELNNTERLPMILNWEIGIESCSAAQKRSDYPCHNKTTECIDRSKTSASSGYFCQCLDGYQGNPYHLDGCQDTDECASNPCKNGKCTNILGNYSCSCNRGYKNQDVITCIKDTSATSLKISLGVSLSFSVLVVAILGIYRERRKSRLKKLKDKYFDANGGVLLQEKMASLGNTARLFTENDIKATTNNYDKGKKVGEGSYGIVYKGILVNQVVAIKKSRVSAPIDPNQNTDPVHQEQITARNQFRNEINALYQINHTNVVRLIGCCLETPTPILVYEFMSKGPIYENIHGQNGKKPSSPLTLAQRLKIAAETAGALAYLHHFAVTRFIHRGVNTSNILLDKNLTAKLSGFGASTPVLGDENEKDKKEKMEKSDDVYSFGLVLVELLTSLKAEEKEVKLFVRSVEGRTLRQTLDEEIWEDRFDKEITKAAELTKKCLNAKAEERPSMKDVASDLEELLRTMPPHPSGGVEDDISPSPKDTGN